MPEVLLLQTANNEVLKVTLIREERNGTNAELPPSFGNSEPTPMWPHHMVTSLVTLFSQLPSEADRWQYIPHPLFAHIAHLQYMVAEQGPPDNQTHLYQIHHLTQQWFNNGLLLHQSILAQQIHNRANLPR